MALFSPERHYPLSQTQWNPNVARQAIADITMQTIEQLNAASYLPAHPMDDTTFGSDLYFGEAGVLWAIDYLQSVGAVETTFDITEHLSTALAKNRQTYAKVSSYPEQSSYLVGELPLLLMQYKLCPSKENAGQVLHSVQKNNNQPIRELMWGMAGSMLAAYFMHQWSQEPQWKDIFRQQAQKL